MRLKALSNINSGQFNAGDVLDLPEAEAQALIDAGAAEAIDPQTPQEAAEQQPPLENSPVASEPELPAVETPATEPVQTEPTQTPQPTPSQIEQDIQSVEAGSAGSKEIHIS